MSLFSEKLKGLLDDTGIFDREEWSQILGVSQFKINQWVMDEAIPRSFNLHMLVVCLEHASDCPPEPLAAFKELYTKSAREISPFGKLMLPNLSEYIYRPVFCELSSKLAKMTLKQQEEFLDKEYPL